MTEIFYFLRLKISVFSVWNWRPEFLVTRGLMDIPLVSVQYRYQCPQCVQWRATKMIHSFRFFLWLYWSLYRQLKLPLMIYDVLWGSRYLLFPTILLLYTDLSLWYFWIYIFLWRILMCFATDMSSRYITAANLYLLNHFYFNCLTRLWNAFPPWFDPNLSISITIKNLKDFMTWSHAFFKSVDWRPVLTILFVPVICSCNNRCALASFRLVWIHIFDIKLFIIILFKAAGLAGASCRSFRTQFLFYVTISIDNVWPMLYLMH